MYKDTLGGIPPATNREIIIIYLICSFLWRAPRKKKKLEKIHC